jgi:hypothetical protein
MIKDREQKEQEQRLQKILQGAFSGPATPLKDIPKKTGESRAAKAGASSTASARSGPPRT